MPNRTNEIVRVAVTFLDGTESYTEWYERDNPQLAESMMRLVEVSKPVSRVNWETLPFDNVARYGSGSRQFGTS
jgi:hypothetical protein